MGVKFKIDKEVGVILTVASGDIGHPDVANYYKQLRLHTDYSSDLDELVDLRDAHFKLTGKEASQLGRWLKTENPVNRSAVVSSQDFGFARMVQGWSEDDISFHVFQDMESAREWLERPPEEEKAMGISFKIDSVEGVIYSVAEGKLGFEDLKTYMTDLRADSNFNTNLVHIFEIRLAQNNISESEVKALASALPVEHTKKLAIVAEGVKRDLALKYKEWVKGLPVEVFTDFKSAREWLDLPPEEE